MSCLWSHEGLLTPVHAKLVVLQWTTDNDIAAAVQSLGVNDFLDVKFFENRANGQSKGYCAISLGSESSSRMVMDKLPRKEIHGMSPVVTFPTKQALNQVRTRPVSRG